MRKIRSLLFTAGIAAVLAIGVGASVATTGRDAIEANAIVSSPYEYEFSGTSFTTIGGPKSLNGIEWTISKSTFTGDAQGGGIQIGKSKQQQPVFTMTTAASNFGEAIIGASVAVSTPKDGTANVSVTVNGNEILNGDFGGDVKTISKPNATPVECAGNVVLTLTNLYNGGKEGPGKAMILNNMSFTFKQGSVEVVPVSSIKIGDCANTIYTGAKQVFTATTNADATCKTVTWSLENANPTDCATIDKNSGEFKAVKPGTVDVVASAIDESGVTARKTMTIKQDAETEMYIEGTPVVQYAGSSFDYSGLKFRIKHISNYIGYASTKDLTFEPEIIAKDTKTVKATHVNGLSCDIPVIVSKENNVICTVDDYPVDHTSSLAVINKNFIEFVQEKGDGSDNVLSSNKEMRVYTGHNFIVKPGLGINITKVIYATTSNEYATKLLSADWINANTTSSGVEVTAIPTDANDDVKFTASKQVRIKKVSVFFEESDNREDLLKIQNWIDNNLKFKGQDGFDSKVTDKGGACKEWFSTAKASLMELIKTMPNFETLFKNEKRFSSAVERYETWASVLGESAYVAGSQSQSIEFDNTIAIISITVIAVLSVSAIAMFAISKRKKASR